MKVSNRIAEIRQKSPAWNEGDFQNKADELNLIAKLEAIGIKIAEKMKTYLMKYQNLKIKFATFYFSAYL